MASGSEHGTLRVTYTRTQKRNVVVAVEHKLFASAIKNFLEPEYEVSHVVQPSRAAHTVRAYFPNMLIFEGSISELKKLRPAVSLDASPTTRIVYLTTDPSPYAAASAVRSGASGYVLKQDGVQEFLAAVRSVASGKTYIARSISDMEVKVLLAGRIQNRSEFGITSRQMEVLQLLSLGKTMKEIADSLNVTVGTVAFHKYGIMQKLNLTNNAELIRYGLQHCVAAQPFDTATRIYAQAGD